MVLGQVRVNPHLIADPIDPVQKQGVGGNLHHHIGAARIPHPGKELLELEGLGGGPLRGKDLLPNHILVCADQAHLFAPGLQNGLEEVGGGSLPVGAGNAHHGHGVRRAAKEVGPRHRQGPAGVRHLDIRNFSLLRQGLTENRRRAGGHGLGDEAVSVHRVAAESHKEVPGLHLPGVVTDLGNLCLQTHVGGEDFQPLQQFLELHTW